jgi:PAS domain S-box-containing protein
MAALAGPSATNLMFRSCGTTDQYIVVKPNFDQPSETAAAGQKVRQGGARAHDGPGRRSRREKWLELLFAHAADGILVHELSGRFIDANPAACKMLGYTRKELLTLHPWDLVTNASRENMLALWQRIRRDHPTVAERVYRRKDGHLVVAEARLSRFESAGQDLIILTCRDVSERKRNEEELRATKQLARFAEHHRKTTLLEERNRMARDVHDTLAQGFTGIIIRLEAAADAWEAGKGSKAAQHLHGACDIARQSLKEARRSVFAHQSPSLTNGNLATALEQLITQITAGAGLKADFRLEGKMRPLPPEWEENLLHLEQEALTNTLRYAHADHFQARLLFKSRSISLSMSDNGRGFAPTLCKGGFGLIGMRQRVKQMGGQLTIKSEIGLGTLIQVDLPTPPAEIAA